MSRAGLFQECQVRTNEYERHLCMRVLLLFAIRFPHFTVCWRRQGMAQKVPELRVCEKEDSTFGRYGSVQTERVMHQDRLGTNGCTDNAVNAMNAMRIF